MSEETRNGVASAQEIRAYAESRQWSEPEMVQLPKSGWRVLLRRPTKFYWALRRATWSTDMVERIDALGRGEVGAQLTPEDRRLWLRAHNQMSMDAFVSPCASLKPGFSEIDLRWFDDSDREFIGRYLGGQVDANGVPLETFRDGEQGNTEAGGNPGQPIQVPADRPAGAS